MIKSIRMIGMSELAAGLSLLIAPAVAQAQDSVFVTTTGNVGIGTSNPGARLEVSGGELRLPPGQGGTGFTHFNFMGNGQNYIRGTTVLADNGGNVGIGTTSPAAKLEVSGGEVRFPPGAGGVGFTHFNLFSDGKNYIRGTTVIADNGGNVGIGTNSPSQPLHVSRSNGTAKVLVEETNGTTAMRNVLELKNNGGIQLLYNRTDGSSNDWQTSNFNATFEISIPGSPSAQFSLASNGNLTISGTLTQMSDRETKTGIVSVQPEEVLAKLVSLPISLWSRKDDDPTVRHLGPMAQDFSAIFGLGEDDRHIAPLDMAGVSMASIQALHSKMTKEMAEKDAEIAELQKELREIKQLLLEKGD